MRHPALLAAPLLAALLVVPAGRAGVVAKAIARQGDPVPGWSSKTSWQAFSEVVPNTKGRALLRAAVIRGGQRRGVLFAIDKKGRLTEVQRGAQAAARRRDPAHPAARHGHRRREPRRLRRDPLARLRAGRRRERRGALGDQRRRRARAGPSPGAAERSPEPQPGVSRRAPVPGGRRPGLRGRGVGRRGPEHRLLELGRRRRSRDALPHRGGAAGPAGFLLFRVLDHDFARTGGFRLPGACGRGGGGAPPQRRLGAGRERRDPAARPAGEPIPNGPPGAVVGGDGGSSGTSPSATSPCTTRARSCSGVRSSTKSAASTRRTTRCCSRPDGAGALRMVARRGDPVPGAPAGTTYASFYGGLSDAEGNVVFRAEVGPGEPDTAVMDPTARAASRCGSGRATPTPTCRATRAWIYRPTTRSWPSSTARC